MFATLLASRALALAELTLIKMILARRPMIAITTKSSTSVKPLLSLRRDSIIIWAGCRWERYFGLVAKNNQKKNSNRHYKKTQDHITHLTFILNESARILNNPPNNFRCSNGIRARYVVLFKPYSRIGIFKHCV